MVGAIGQEVSCMSFCSEKIMRKLFELVNNGIYYCVGVCVCVLTAVPTYLAVSPWDWEMLKVSMSAIWVYGIFGID